MFLSCLAVDQDIVQVYLTEQVDIQLQYIIHEPLLCSRGSSEPKWHY
jgi:hypothetical protein